MPEHHPNAAQLVAKAIRDQMDRLGLSNASMADHLNVDPGTLAGWINGRHVPRPQSLVDLSRRFGWRGNTLTHLARTGAFPDGYDTPDPADQATEVTLPHEALVALLAQIGRVETQVSSLVQRVSELETRDG